MLDGVSYAADEAAAAHRNQYDLHVGQLIQNFQADSTLPRNDLRVIERVDESIPFLFLKLAGVIIRVVIGAFNKTDLCAVCFSRFHLADGRAIRHADNAWDIAALSRQRNALSMVARAACNNAFCLFVSRKLADFIIGAAHLKTACYLQIFSLQIDFALCIESRSSNQIRFSCNRFQYICGVIDFVQCEHAVSFFPLLFPLSDNVKNNFTTSA